MGFLLRRPRKASGEPEMALPGLEQLLEVLIPTAQRQLRYEDAIGWFVDQRPRGGAATRGAILRVRRRDGRIEVIQIFLNANGQPLANPRGGAYGRRLIVENMDDELIEAFGGTGLLIVD